MKFESTILSLKSFSQTYKAFNSTYRRAKCRWQSGGRGKQPDAWMADSLQTWAAENPAGLWPTYKGYPTVAGGDSRRDLGQLPRRRVLDAKKFQ